MRKRETTFTARICYNLAVFVVIILLTITPAYTAQISFMAGDVKVIRHGKIQKAQFQMKLETGDVLKTGKRAFADISYEDGSIIKVKQNSNVTIGNNNIKNSDSLSLTSGIITGKFAKLKKGSSRKVYTPTTVASIRGTEFDVAVSESGDSKVQLSKGALDLLNPYGITSVKGKKNVEVGVAQAPKKTKEGDLEEWKDNSDNELDSNPEEKSDAFDSYIKNFGKRSKGASNKIDDLERKQSITAMGGKNKMEKANKEIEDIESNVEDDMYLSAAANKSIDGILNRFQRDKKEMYDTFLRIKEESNRVLEQQKRNYEAIMAVKEAYRKAYEEIMKKHKEAVDKIKGSIDTEQYKRKK